VPSERTYKVKKGRKSERGITKTGEDETVAEDWNIEVSEGGTGLLNKKKREEGNKPELMPQRH